MAMAVAISPGIYILLIFLQNTLAQQCFNNVGFKSSGVPQQTFQNNNCGSNQIAQNGMNSGPSQQMHQYNYQQQSNIQQVPFAQQSSNVQPQLNFQQSNSQQHANLMSNTQLKPQNQDLAANIISALYNIKQSSQNQRSNTAKGPSQQINFEPVYQNQPNPTFTISSPTSKSQNSQPPVSNSYSESMQPAFTFQFTPSNTVPEQSNQQIFTLPVHKVSTNNQKQSYSIQSQPVTNQQESAVQNSVVMIPTAQLSSAQNQPILLALQSPQTSSVQNQPTLSTSQTQPIIYTVQTQPSSGTNQNQQLSEVSNQQQGMNVPMDKQSLMNYVMSQMQNQQQTGATGNMLTSILPAMLNTKSEKSSSMKTILPLIISLLSERRGCSGCPHCGCNANTNNEIKTAEPIINSGYSNQMNYSQQPAEVLSKMTEYVNKSVTPTSNDTKQEKPKAIAPINNSEEISEEEDDSEEEYDEE